MLTRYFVIETTFRRHKQSLQRLELQFQENEIRAKPERVRQDDTRSTLSHDNFAGRLSRKDFKKALKTNPTRKQLVDGVKLDDN